MKEHIQEFFKIPEDFSILELAQRLKLLLVYMLEIALLSSLERAKINAMIEYLSEIRAAEVPRRSRAELHNHLRSSPLISTLMLLDEPSADIYCDNEINRQYAFLVHLYCARGLHDYSAYLQFYRCFIERVEQILTLAKLLDLTTRELQIYLKKASDRCMYLSEILPYFLKNERIRAHVKHELLAKENKHIAEIDDDISLVETTDVSGEENSKLLLVGARVELNRGQQQRKFWRKITGAQRALYNFESAVPLGMHAALPVELEEFFECCAPALLRGNSSNLDLNDAPFWLIFFIKVLGVHEPFQLVLVNTASAKLAELTPINLIRYKLHKDSSSVVAELELRADLLKTLEPDGADVRLHFIARKHFSMQLPANILDLLSLVLRQLDSCNRHNVTISQALKIDEVIYRAWFNEKLARTELKIRAINQTALERSFKQFSRNTLPETYTAFLSQKTTVQSHYVSATMADIATKILRSWRDFCNASNIRWSYLNANETAEEKVLNIYNSEIGSKITLRDEFFRALFPSLLQTASINDIALYVYLRVATTSALRPVIEVFPSFEHIDLSYGWMTVPDKRVHSKDERRLVVLTTSVCRMLHAWKLAAAKVSFSKLIDQPTHALMFLDDMTWRHFEPALVNQQLFLRTEQHVRNHSFRHVAAKKLIKLNKDFDQRLLNFLMNHSRYGVGILDQYSCLSPIRAAALLREKLEKNEIEFKELDAQALILLESLA